MVNRVRECEERRLLFRGGNSSEKIGKLSIFSIKSNLFISSVHLPHTYDSERVDRVNNDGYPFAGDEMHIIMSKIKGYPTLLFHC